MAGSLEKRVSLPGELADRRGSQKRGVMKGQEKLQRLAQKRA